MINPRNLLIALILVLLVGFAVISFLPANPRQEADNYKVEQLNLSRWDVNIIPQGGSIYGVLEKYSLPAPHVAIVSYRMGEYVDVTTIQPGDTLKVLLNKEKSAIDRMQFVQEPTTRHLFEVRPDSLIYTQELLPVTESYRIVEGHLESTLDQSLIAAGLPASSKQQINNGLEAEINFQRDARKGDKFTVLVKERIFENKPLPGAIVYYVRYEGERTGTKELWRFEDSTDDKSVLNGLYNQEGKSNTTSSVGYPLSSIHVVSPFGYRADPFTGRRKMHQGVDYRGRYGTPIYAVANGVVTDASYHNGWGNKVQIKHNSGMETLYAHCSSMSVRKGQRVRKGQIIARVGSTGRSTGAHLHFGLISGGKYINPTNLKMVGAETLNAAQKAEFEKQKASIMQRIASLLSVNPA